MAAIKYHTIAVIVLTRRIDGPNGTPYPLHIIPIFYILELLQIDGIN
jgi:hypothetical protein